MRHPPPHQRPGWLQTMRRCLGLICLALGIAGIILPVLPGWPFLIPAIALLGPRDPALRHSHLLLRRTLRYLRSSRHPTMRAIGVHLSNEYVRTRQQFKAWYHRS